MISFMFPRKEGSFGLRPAYGLSTPEGYFKEEKMSFPRRHQQAAQMDAFARNILDDTPVIASGEDGLQDLKVIEAVYKSAETRERIVM